MALSELIREDFLYQPYYCEENIWQLCQHELFKDSYVVFIASKGDAFPMLNQRAMISPVTPVYWDYHVVLLVPGETNQLLDFDTRLAFNNEAGEYFRNSFIDNELLNADEKPWFRVVPASEFIQLFSSDRRHMKTEFGWLAPPPAWPLIGNATHNLSSFTDMTNGAIGEVLAYDAVLARFACQ